jgi:gamma-glutamyltranspeptidase/glutathione hydrolase
MKRTIFPLLLLLFIILPGHRPLDFGRAPLYANKVIVASDSQLASRVGKEIYRQGGNVMDAAVATAFAMAVTFPAAGNVGGGGFMVYHDSKGNATTIDFREKAPAGATQNMYVDAQGNYIQDLAHAGTLSVGVPGTVAGLFLAHSKYGKLPWAKVVEPAMNLAESGFAFPYTLYLDAKYSEKQWRSYPSTTRVMFRPNGDFYQPGETWKQPDLAATLKRIKEKGRDGFYKGETAEKLAAFFKQNKGLITKDDLEKYEAVERKPVTGTYRGYKIYSMPPPSSGGISLIQMLNVLEGYDLKKMGFNSAEYVHVLSETMRRAYANRAEYLGDPDFNSSIPVDKLLSKDYANTLRAGINLDKASVSDSTRYGKGYEGTHTTHLSVMDAEGNAVSLTYTIEQGYGSQIVAEGLGFFLNNEMGDFNVVPNLTNSQGDIGTAPNLVRPGKRMLSSMTPTILTKDGKVVMVVGAEGGRTIITTVLQTILNCVDHGMNIGEAMEAGRIHHQWLPDRIDFERFSLSADAQEILKRKGHKINETSYQGSATGIFYNSQLKALTGSVDSRFTHEAAEGY